MHVRRLTEDNKEDKELVDATPHWGESRISCVMVDLCDRCDLCLVLSYLCMLDASDIVA